MEKSTLEELGGRTILEKVMHAFYDKVYEHPWLGRYFEEVPQEVIEKQQVDFMIGSLGGPKSVYSGRFPVEAHKNMFISEKLFDIRENLLLEALEELNAPQELIDRWMKIDQAFRPSIVKESIDDCEKTFVTDEILIYPDPEDKNAA